MADNKHTPILANTPSTKPSIVIRELGPDDNCEELIGLLANLTSAPPLSPEEFQRILKVRQTTQSAFTRVAIDSESGKMVGTTSLVLETKFFRGGATIGHIEDVVVHPDYRGCGIARLLMDSVIQLAREFKCYKVILDCTEDKIPLYTKFGFVKKEIQMRMDL